MPLGHERDRSMPIRGGDEDFSRVRAGDVCVPVEYQLLLLVRSEGRVPLVVLLLVELALVP